MKDGKHRKQTSSANSIKRALIASAACTILCGLLLFSTSVAWFTANKESGVNELYSGNLDIELSYSKTMNSDDWHEVTTTTNDIFKVCDNNMLWEPGAVNVVYFRIENKGSLAAKYDFMVDIDSEVTGTNFANEEFRLSRYIMGGVVEDVSAAYEATDAGRKAAIDAISEHAKTLQEIHTGAPLITDTMSGIPAGSTEAADDTTKTFALVLYMPDDVGDVINYKTRNDDTLRPSVKLKVKLVATQMTGEADSFGNEYDKGAYEIKVPAGATATETKKNLLNAIASADNGQSVALPKGTTIDLTGTTISNGTGVTVVGAEGTTLEVSTNGAAPSVNADGVTFEGVTFDYGNQTYNAIRGTVVYWNCTFNGLVNSYDNSTFINCTFNNDDGQYLAHVYAGSASFTGCIFNGSNRCVYVYTDGADATATFTGCTFMMTSVDKSAVMLNSRNNGETYTVTISNCSQTGGNDQGTNSSDGSSYDYRGLYGFKHDPAIVDGTVTVDGVIVYNHPAT